MNQFRSMQIQLKISSVFNRPFFLHHKDNEGIKPLSPPFLNFAIPPLIVADWLVKQNKRKKGILFSSDFQLC